MGLFDTVMVPCPTCGTRMGFQSKGGPCRLKTYELEDAPSDVLSNVNRHSPHTCSNCGAQFAVHSKAIRHISHLGIPVLVGQQDLEDDD